MAPGASFSATQSVPSFLPNFPHQCKAFMAATNDLPGAGNGISPA